MSQSAEAPKSVMQRILDIVETVGNKVPHPAMIFLILIVIVVVLSHVLYLTGASVSYEAIVPEVATEQAGDTESNVDTVIYDTGMMVDYESLARQNYTIETRSVAARSLLTVEGLRFMYASFIPNFMAFTAVGLMIAAIVGAGVAEESGLVKAMIRKLVIISPRWALTYILAFVGILSSLAADAGYVVLIPLAGMAFLSIGRHPLAGLALGFAAVAGAFTVNMLIKPLDAVLVEFTNDAIQLVDPDLTIGLASNLWFSFASVVFLTIVVGVITERMIEPRLGPYRSLGDTGEGSQESAGLSEDESRGLRYAGLGLLGVLVVFGLLALPPGAPLRNAETDELIGNSPFMNAMIVLIMVLFLASGAAFGFGARTFKNTTDIIQAIEKALSALGGLLFLFLIISQFVAYFNYSNMGTILALTLSDALQAANIGPLALLIGFIVVVALIDLLITGAIAKWALFAPIFVPLLLNLGVDPEAVLAAYRVGDSPVNAITPLNAYFALVVGFAQKYDKDAGVGTVVALMLPYVVWMFLLWTALFAVWFLLGLPWGL